MRRMFNSAKIRAAERGLPIDIDLKYLLSIAVDKCPALGIDLIYQGNRIYPNSASLDKFDPRLGYTKGNVFIISHRANLIKTDAATEEVQMVADWMHGIETLKKEAV